MFSNAARALGLPQVHPYQLRHGGAAHDLLFRRRERAAVKARGRWVTESSLRRYTKTGQVQKMLNAVSPAVLKYCNDAQKLLPTVVFGRTPPPPPPAQ